MLRSSIIIGEHLGRASLQQSFQNLWNLYVVSSILRLPLFRKKLTNRVRGMPVKRMMCVILCQDRRENQFQVDLREIPSSLRGSVDACSIE
jgi:hypothetical protein